MSRVADILQELISVPSVNPRLGGPGDGPTGEHALSAWLIDFCRQHEWRYARQRVDDDRTNVVALVPGDPARVWLWDAHQDTVSAQGMTVEPFRARTAAERIYGRGACDVKGGMAAMLAAAAARSDRDAGDGPTVLLSFTVNEECGFTGARALADVWRQGGSTDAASRLADDGGLGLDELRSLRPDAAIVAEPTELNVVVAHRGVVRWQCRTHGRAAHSSQPELGVNAVYAMAQVVQLIDAYHRTELAGRPADPRCGASTVSVTTFHGGSGANTIPDAAVVDVDRRLRPDEAPDEAYRALVDWLAARAELGDCRLAHDPPWMQSRGLAAEHNLALAERVAAAARGVGRGGDILGVPYGTNAATIASAGIPTVVFGPGSIAQAHTADEWIAVDELEAAVTALAAVLAAG